MVLNGCKAFPLHKGSKVLYLGAANGTTVSHVSDIIEDGTVYAVEFSNRAFRKLLAIATERTNIIPILHDARKPDGYRSRVGAVEIIYQDIAQRDQCEIFLANVARYLPMNGVGILMIKSRSIDVTASPKAIFRSVEQQLQDNHCELLETIDLEPFEKDHEAVIIRRTS
jgi:fibrillarin-like pre-rRNA processing protein